MLVHCPACGAALTVTPRISQVKKDPHRVFFLFEQALVEHECGKTR